MSPTANVVKISCQWNFLSTNNNTATHRYENDGNHRDSLLCSREPKQLSLVPSLLPCWKTHFSAGEEPGYEVKAAYKEKCNAFMCTGLAVPSVCILTFFDSSWKKSLARSAIFCSGSSRQSAIALIWPLTFIMSLRMRCVSTTRVFFLTTGESSRRLHGMRGQVWGTYACLNTVATVSLCSSWAQPLLYSVRMCITLSWPEEFYPDLRMIEVFSDLANYYTVYM